MAGIVVTLLILITGGMASTNYRLPKAIVPQHYWITLMPTFEKEDFLTSGKVRVLVSCREPTSEVVFNSNGIHIDSGTLSIRPQDEGPPLPVIRQEADSEAQKYTVKVGSALRPDEKYYLEMDFSYKLNENLEGFYRSSYTDSLGKTRWLATTQFSPINARRAFPCWDEPSFKAVFNITIGRESHMTSISNMPTYLTTPMKERAGWFWDHHESSLPVSTYLVAFIVTDLPHKDLVNTSSPHFKVWSRPEILEDMDYMGEISPKILKFIAEYFKTPFPLQKIDLFAVPDFGFSAMENWGLITFAESAIKASKTIAHELAHQWFGNLVTPEWWEDLWLKEGFATFIGITALDGVNGNSNETDKWIVAELHDSMFEDSLWASHPVSNPVDDPRKIWQAFDAISYEKGSSIIRMMCEFLGEDIFRQGLKNYLTRYAFGNARRQDLWRSYDGLTEANVSSVMDRWTLQTGYPVLTVTRDYSSSEVSLSQERFLLNGSRDEMSQWHIPHTLTFRSDKRDKINVSWLKEARGAIHPENLQHNDWLLMNLKRSGYYRVNYDRKNWDLLIKDFHNLPRLSKAQLINDAYNLAIPGKLEYEVPFRLAEKLYDSKDKLLWNVTIAELRNMNLLLRDTDAHNDFKEYALSLFPSENISYSSEEKVLVKFASYLGQKSLINESIQAMEAFLGGKDLSYPEEVLSSIYCNGVRYGDNKVWPGLWSRYLGERKPAEKSRLLIALTCSREPANLSRLLDALLRDDSGVRKQEAKGLFGGVAANQQGTDLALDFLLKNWDKIKERYGLGYKIMSAMVLSFRSVLTHQYQLEKLLRLYNDHLEDLGSTSNAFLNTLERVQININWLKRHYETVKHIIKNSLK